MTLDLGAKVARRYLDAYENQDYNSATNGESAVLSRLRDLPLTQIVDVGAHRGEWAALARVAFPKATIHCFEIAPQNARVLRSALAHDERVIINEFGLLDTTGDVMGYFDPVAPSTTSLHQNPLRGPGAAPVTPFRGSVMRGDDYLEQSQVSELGYLKVDTEGADLQVLTGFVGALQAHRIRCVQFEYSPWNTITRTLLRDFVEFLEPLGYCMGWIYPNHVEFRAYGPHDEDFRGRNLIAVRRDDHEVIERLG